MSWLWGSSSEPDSNTSSSSSSYDFSSSGIGSDSSSSFDSGSSSFGSSSFDSDRSSFGDNSLSEKSQGKDAEMQMFIAQEEQKAQMQKMIHDMNDICWDTCMGSPENKLSSRTETCISNCVERFIDSSLFITNRFAQLLSKQAG